MNTPPPLTLDVRPELRAGGEPFPRIMQALARLAPGQTLRLLATFEPIPLYHVLGRKGFAHQAIRHGPEDWEILFTPAAEAAIPRPRQEAGEAADWPEPAQSLDNRGLHPPEPMIRILSALENLPPGAVLEAWNDREPLLLYPELEARGARIMVSRRAEGVQLLIRRGMMP